MSYKKLVIDKSNVKLDHMFQSLKIVEENGGKIDREEFGLKMQIYMKKERKTRNQINKSKLARYYGLLRWAEEEGTQYIVLSKRGQEVCDIIKKLPDNTFSDIDKNELKTIILTSIFYDTFGKNNDGVEESVSDVEPPKIVLKSILDLNYITKKESIYLIYGLNYGVFKNYDEGISVLKEIREKPNPKKFIQEKIDEKKWTNYASDNKLITFLEKIDILYKEKDRYFLSTDTLKNYKDLIKTLNPVSKNLQMIIVGNPGSGKSYYINNIILGNIVETKQVVRTIVYPDYTYSDFIGYVRPLTMHKKINYTFEPGPFTIALEKCFKNPNSNIYLVVEEINRGNIQAIFGDVFQLLDRIDDFMSEKHGCSKYSIINNDIYNYLTKQIADFTKNNKNQKTKKYRKKYLKDNKIILPPNFNIIMTLNNSEENNYFIDTAFRRRFNYLFLGIDDTASDNDYLIELDKISKKNIFNEKYSWSEFRTKINKIIDEINKEFYTIPEAKKLSPYFVNIDDVNDKKQFCDKVIYYLKNDVFKYHERYFNTNYDKIRDLFINGTDFFDIMEGNYGN